MKCSIVANSESLIAKCTIVISSYTQQKKISSPTRGCSLLIFTAINEAITNLTQYELSQEESNLLKGDLQFSNQPDKIQKFENLHYL